MKISYSAPAKVILSGEHAVVYGKPALVCAIDLRMEFTLWSKKNQLNHGRDRVGNIKLMKKIVESFLKKEEKHFFHYQINSEIPIGRGLGSSASLSVAAIASLLEFFTGKIYSKKIINQLAYEAEKYFHQNPSGVDNATVCYGGLIYYRKEFEFLKNITHLSFNIPKSIENRLFLIDSGAPEEKTKEMVDWVKKNYSKKTEAIILEIEKITKKMTLSLKEQDSKEFEKSIFENEKQLEKLGVVSNKTVNLLSHLSDYGVGKITGAGGRKGGSGYILFLAKKINQLKEYCQNNKINYFKLNQSQLGLLR